jgi:hypothetical protein
MLRVGISEAINNHDVALIALVPQAGSFVLLPAVEMVAE